VCSLPVEKEKPLPEGATAICAVVDPEACSETNLIKFVNEVYGIDVLCCVGEALVCCALLVRRLCVVLCW
jgi:hypothetical protein